MPEITARQIEHLFQHYKDLEPGKWAKILRWDGPEEVHRPIAVGIARVRGCLLLPEGRVIAPHVIPCRRRPWPSKKRSCGGPCVPRAGDDTRASVIAPRCRLCSPSSSKSVVRVPLR